MLFQFYFFAEYEVGTRRHLPCSAGCHQAASGEAEGHILCLGILEAQGMGLCGAGYVVTEIKLSASCMLDTFAAP